MVDNLGASPPDFATPTGQVRLLVGDTDPAPYIENGSPINGKGIYLWYSDTEIVGLLALNAGNVRLAAAHVIESIAMSQALMLKKWSSADLSVDGAAVSDALLKRAKLLRDQAGDDAGATIAEYVRLVNTGRPTPDWAGWYPFSIPPAPWPYPDTVTGVM